MLKNNPEASKWAFFGIGMLVVVATAANVYRQHVRGEQNRQVGVLLARIGGEVSRLQSLHWEALVRGDVDPDFLNKLRSARMELLQTGSRLKQLTRGAQALRPFYLAYSEYVAAMDQELLLLAVGRMKEVHELDTERVSPGYEKLGRVTDEAQELYGKVARDQIRQAELQSLLSLLGLAAALLLLFWRYERANRVAKMALVEQEALRRSEDRFRSLTENSTDIVAVFGPGGVTRYVTPSVENILGCPKVVSPRTDVLELVHPEDRELARTALENSMRRPGEVVTVLVRFRHANGTWVYLEAVCRSLLEDPNVQGVVVNSRDVSDRKRAEERLRHEAFYDSLTDLPNRALFLDHLQDRLRRATRDGDHRFGILFIDVDGFKRVNDSFGHAAGDELIIAVARRLVKQLRLSDPLAEESRAQGARRPGGGDMLARLGGDEFCAMLDYLRDPSDLMRSAERIHKAMGEPFVIAESEVFVSASIGVSLGGNNYAKAEDLVRDADIAMYRAKALGKARSEVFDEAMRERVLSRLKLETDLRRALEREEFVLYYQPIVWLETGRIVALEALVRWNHPEAGFIGPGGFVAVAEETGLIVPIGEWILRGACRQAKRWNKMFATEPPLTMSVNISARQFLQPGLVDQVERALGEADLDPGSLKLEITESVAMASAETTNTILRALKRLGVRLSMDDFGTGYSSLSYLQRFAFNTLKIDRAFVRNLEEDNESREIVRSIVLLAHTLGLDVVAEGTETASQADFLKRLGCEFGQGYLFSPPMDQKAVEELLAQNVSAVT